MLTIQNYVQAESLEQAWQLNQKKSTRILGGMLWLKMAKNTVGTAVDLCRLGLDAIEEDETQFSLGAMVTLRQLEQHPGLNAYTGGAAEKASGTLWACSSATWPRWAAACGGGSASLTC